MLESPGRAVACGIALLLCAVSGCAETTEHEELVTSSAEALAACRSITLVAATKYSGGSTSIQSSGVTFTPAAAIAVPAVIPVSLGGAGTGDAQLTITWNDASTVCHYSGSGGTQYTLASCAPAHASGEVVTATQVVLRVNSGDRSNPAHETDATLLVTEVAGCAASNDAGTPDAGKTDAGADAGKTDAGADAGKTDAGSSCTSAASCDDHNACTTDKCTSGACVHTAASKGTSCSDGNACNGSEACGSSGQCLAGTAPAIDDGNVCTVDSCDPASGVSHVAVTAGTSCSDGNACNGVEACNGAAQCAATGAPVIDDGNACTVDSCDPATGAVVHAPQPQGHACSADLCNQPQSCDGNGSCVSVPAPVVDDDNPCTWDSCNNGSGVYHLPFAAGTACGDNSNPCVGAHACDGHGACAVGPGPAIDDGDACTADACSSTGLITHVALRADDDNPCTVDRCDPVTGLAHDPTASGTSCSNGNACDGDEACDGAGSCRTSTGAPIVDDGNTCTVDWCDATTGVAHVPAPAGTACRNGDACDGDESCDSAGGCRAGAPPAIDDGDACTSDRCEPALGVIHEAIASDACVSAESAWTAASIGRPQARDGAAAVFDGASKSLLLFGGENAGAALGNLWTWSSDGRAWTPSDT